MLDRIQRLALATLDKLGADRARDAAAVLFGRSQKLKPLRHRGEFDTAQLTQRVDVPTVPSRAFSWTLEDIYGARARQQEGNFLQPVKLVESFPTDDALFTAMQNRLDPIASMDVELEAAAGTTKAGSIAGEADVLFGNGGTALSKDTERSINQDLANHGLAIGVNQWCERQGSGRIDVVHRHWPLRDVCWDELTERFLANVTADQEPPPTTAPAHRSSGRLITQVPIVHGDGRWVVYRKQEHHPWQFDAACLPGALVWARHAFPTRDWMSSSETHGNHNWVGTLPPSVPLQQRSEEDPDKIVLTPEAQAMLDLMADLAGLQRSYGVIPNGAGVDLKVDSSRVWEVFERLMTNAETAAARIWLGTDGTLGPKDGTPGYDVVALFGVAATKVQGDVGAITRGVKTGIIEPWGALNFGSSLHVPKRLYKVPNPDLQKAIEEHAANELAYATTVKARRDAGLEVTKKWLTELAKRLNVSPARPADSVEAPPASGVQTIGAAA
jgi:hypothetical protein